MDSLSSSPPNSQCDVVEFSGTPVEKLERALELSKITIKYLLALRAIDEAKISQYRSLVETYDQILDTKSQVKAAPPDITEERVDQTEHLISTISKASSLIPSAKDYSCLLESFDSVPTVDDVVNENIRLIDELGNGALSELKEQFQPEIL